MTTGRPPPGVRDAIIEARRTRLAQRTAEVASIVGAAVRLHRLAARLDIAHLADRSVIPRRTLESIERGKSAPRLYELVSLARGIGCPAASLVRDLPDADYERTAPRPEYRWNGAYPPGTATATPRDGSDKARVLAGFGTALRNCRRASQRRPLDLIARDAGMTCDGVMRIERGRSNALVAELVNVADACEITLAEVLDCAGL